jgi:hypothetical protein
MRLGPGAILASIAPVAEMISEHNVAGRSRASARDELAWRARHAGQALFRVTNGT